MNDMPSRRGDISLKSLSSSQSTGPKEDVTGKRDRAAAEMRRVGLNEASVGEESPSALKLQPDLKPPSLLEGGGPPRLPSLQKSDIPKLPHGRQTGYGTLISFLVLVVLPVAAAVVYFGFIASNQYIAEFRFSVQDRSASAMASSAGALMSAMGGSSVGSPQNYVVVDYLKSRQALDELRNRGVDVRAMYSRPDIDWWSRFSAWRPMERFVLYWQDMISADYDQYTGLATVQVRAFSAEDAKRIADNLATLSEELINRIAMRANVDAVRFAEGEVVREEESLRKVRARLTEFRNKAGVIDANASVSASNSSLTQTLRANLAQLETSLAALLKQNLPQNSVQVQNLKSQIAATKDQIKTVEALVAKNPEGKPLSTVVGEYEDLDMERQFAQTMVTSAMQALDTARATAAAQWLYITPYVRPVLPEGSTYPKRLTSIFLVAVASLLIWTILMLTARSMREHYT